jgi:hypothetical protein
VFKDDPVDGDDPLVMGQPDLAEQREIMITAILHDSLIMFEAQQPVAGFGLYQCRQADLQAYEECRRQDHHQDDDGFSI